MEVCMTYYKENEIEAIYLFGDPKSSSKGIMRIDKIQPLNSGIIKLPDDGSICIKAAMKALVKLIKKAEAGELPKKLSYCPGW